MELKTIEKELLNPDFFKKACPEKFLFWSFWKKSYEQYNKAQERGVCKAVTLREATYEDRAYRVLAYSVNGELSNTVIEELKQQINSADIGNIRYEAHGTNGFFPLLNEEGELQWEDHELKGLYKNYNGVFLIITSEQKEKKDRLQCSQIVYVKNGKSMSHWALADKNIN